jgi:hypothetical protein
LWVIRPLPELAVDARPRHPGRPPCWRRCCLTTSPSVVAFDEITHLVDRIDAFGGMLRRGERAGSPTQPQAKWLLLIGVGHVDDGGAGRHSGT